ncbi:MAG: hypothetical protein ACOCXQ_00045 [Patescibacteria group bacterium]
MAYEQDIPFFSQIKETLRPYVIAYIGNRKELLSNPVSVESVLSLKVGFQEYLIQYAYFQRVISVLGSRVYIYLEDCVIEFDTNDLLVEARKWVAQHTEALENVSLFLSRGGFTEESYLQSRMSGFTLQAKFFKRYTCGKLKLSELVLAQPLGLILLDDC